MACFRAKMRTALRDAKRVAVDASQGDRADGIDGGLMAMIFTSSKCPYQDCKR